MPRLPSCQGFETPKPLTINVTHGDGDIVEVLSDVLALTKVNYNACDFPSALPVTFKFADRVGEILMASPRPITAPTLSSALSRLGGTAGYLRKRTAGLLITLPIPDSPDRPTRRHPASTSDVRFRAIEERSPMTEINAQIGLQSLLVRPLVQHSAPEDDPQDAT